MTTHTPALSAHADLEVPFQDIDGMQVAWHGNYFRYFEAARVVLLRRFDFDYPQMCATGFVWPITEVHARFVKPIRYAQRIRVVADLLEWQNRIKIGYLIQDGGNGQRLATGYTIQCAVDANTGELQLVSPPELLERLKKHLGAAGESKPGKSGGVE